MDSRRNLPPAYDEHSRMMRRGALPPTQHSMEPLPLPELLDKKMASQAAEIEQLTIDNRKLAASYVSLRQELDVAKGEAEKIREHTRSIQNEGDIQIRILLDRIAKTDAGIGSRDTIKTQLQAANSEARNLMTAKLELSVKLDQATKELEYSRENIRKIPEMRSELDSLRQEYQRLRKTFEYEKCSNTEKVEELKVLEKDLIGVAEEVERLRAEILNVGRRAPITYRDPYINQDNRYPLPYQSNGGCTDSFGRSHHQTGNGAAVGMMNPYAGGGFPVGVGASGDSAWEGIYRTSQAVGARGTSAPVSGVAICEEVGDTSSAKR